MALHHQKSELRRINSCAVSQSGKGIFGAIAADLIVYFIFQSIVVFLAGSARKPDSSGCGLSKIHFIVACGL